MNRRVLILGGLICGLVLATAFAIAAEHQETYVIEMRLSIPGNDGKSIVVSRPTLMTLKNQEAVLHVGGKTSLAGAKLEPKDYADGISIRAMLYDGPNQNLMIDAVYTRSDKLQTITDASRFTTQQVRIVEPVRLDKTVTIPLDAGDEKSAKMKLEICVTQGKSTPPFNAAAGTTTTVATPPAAK